MYKATLGDALGLTTKSKFLSGEGDTAIYNSPVSIDNFIEQKYKIKVAKCENTAQTSCMAVSEWKVNNGDKIIQWPEKTEWLMIDKQWF